MVASAAPKKRSGRAAEVKAAEKAVAPKKRAAEPKDGAQKRKRPPSSQRGTAPAAAAAPAAKRKREKEESSAAPPPQAADAGEEVVEAVDAEALRASLEAMSKETSTDGPVNDNVVKKLLAGDVVAAAKLMHAWHKDAGLKTPDFVPTLATFAARTLAAGEAAIDPLKGDLLRLLAHVSTLTPDGQKPTARGFTQSTARAMLRLGLPRTEGIERVVVAAGENQAPEEQRRRDLIRQEPVHAKALCATACLSAARPFITPDLLDELARLFGIRVLVSLGACADLHHVKHGRKLGAVMGMVEAAIVKRLKDAHMGIPVAQVEQELGWSRGFARAFGPLEKVLARCKGSFILDAPRHGPVKVTATADGSLGIELTKLPLGGDAREVQNVYTRTAIEEVLACLPPQQVKTLVSAVGVRIRSWGAFNRKHGGKLGPNLNSFLLQHPEHFTTTGKLVWRADPESWKRVPTADAEPKYGGRDEDDDSEADIAAEKKVKGKRGRRKKLHDSIAEKWERRKLRANKLRSLKMQKIPGFGKKKAKHTGKGTKPHWAK